MAADPEMAARLRAARARFFKTGSEAARFHGWPSSTYLAHENAQNGFVKSANDYARAYRVSSSWLIFNEGDGPKPILQIMGYIGAGATIEPDFEQVPPDGLSQVELPFPVPEDLIGFEVRGDSMLPRYDDGDVVVCWRDRQADLDEFLGEELAVRTEDGRRYLKNVTKAGGKGIYDLLSWNAKPIPGVRIAWFSDIYLTLRAKKARTLSRASAQSGRKPGRGPRSA